MTTAPPEKVPAGAPVRGAIAKIPPFDAAGRFFEGRSKLDAGDPASAAGSWLQMTTEESRNGFTIQIAIACQEDSVTKASERTRGSVEFFMVPFPLQGKTCYRLCWGAYPTLEEAQAGKASVPDFFRSDGGDLVVVSLKKLAPPENR
jgi:hypothetical protein